MTATVAALLQRARALGVERLDAQWLLAHHLQRSRAWLIAHDDDPVEADAATRCEAALARRADGEPVAYLVGEREFHGLALQVSPAVLVPRPDTETLVDWALERLAAPPFGNAEARRVLDLGTGSGAIALAVKHDCPRACVTAVDASTAALEVARANAARLGLDIRFMESDWFSALPGERFHLLLSNPPYIAERDPHLPALRHEPMQALTSGADGLDALRHLAAHAPDHLEAGGWLLVEHGFDQADAVQALLRSRGFTDVQTRLDLASQPRCTGGRWTQ